MRTARAQPCGYASKRRLVHRLLAGVIGTERLREKDRQRLGRWEKPFTMRRQQRLDLLEQLRSRQQVKERIRIAVARMALNAPVLLYKRRRGSMHSGLLLRGWMAAFQLPLTTPNGPATYLFIKTFALSKCHSILT